jgi:hypothetical protein
MAQEALKLTERAKRDRILRTQTDEDVTDEPVHGVGHSSSGIEVTHSNSSSQKNKFSLVIGEEDVANDVGEIVEGVFRSKSETNLATRKARTLHGFRRSISNMVGKRRESLPQGTEV